MELAKQHRPCLCEGFIDILACLRFLLNLFDVVEHVVDHFVVHVAGVLVAVVDWVGVTFLFSQRSLLFQIGSPYNLCTKTAVVRVDDGEFGGDCLERCLGRKI